MRRIPILATTVVVAAGAVMIGLGIWQLERAEWKTELLNRYRAAAALPPVDRFEGTPPEDLPFRRAVLDCVRGEQWSRVHGRSARGEPGWSHRLACRTARAERVHVDMGWSRSTIAAVGWRPGVIEGVLVPDRQHGVRLVADTPPSGLQPSAAPSIDDIPNNHLLYAVEWFFFAAAAAFIYVLALGRRLSRGASAPKSPAP